MPRSDFKGVDILLSDGSGIAICKFPDRKKWSLCFVHKGQLKPVASLDGEHAKELAEFMTKLTRAQTADTKEQHDSVLDQHK